MAAAVSARALQRGVDQFERVAGRDRQRGRLVRAARRAATSAAWRRPIGGQRRIGPALEAALGDERRLAVADEDERRVEAVGDRAAGAASRVRRQRRASRAGSSTGR